MKNERNTPRVATAQLLVVDLKLVLWGNSIQNLPLELLGGPRMRRFGGRNALGGRWETDFYPVRALEGIVLATPKPVVDKNRAPIGPEMLSSAGAGVWREAPMAFPDSSSVLDKFLVVDIF